mmetsp:Transcript_36765/g.51951  ORF Transcript_36765/g.51951 Transcript_36765/m.51951 type:complete len:93 (-) Transcript_36765:31-309(-)
MSTCIVLHNICVEERVVGTCGEKYNPMTSSELTATVEFESELDERHTMVGYDSDESTNMMVSYMGQRFSSLADTTEHYRLRNSLIEHLTYKI